MSERSGALAHQFDDLEQQRDTATLGMWAFLATEVMFFGGLFLVFTIYRLRYTEAFAEAARHLDYVLGAINTAVLLTSSLTVVLAVHAAHHGRRKQLTGWLIATIVLGAAFLVIKGSEYYHEYENSMVPVLRFHYEGPQPARIVELFLGLYFVMTSLHALHMIIGLGLFAVLAWKAWRGRFSSEYYNPVEVGGLYWHFVDVVWIFLFPILYLLFE